jgi:hypothetical protein
MHGPISSAGDRLVPANDPDFVHTLEGPDDMPAHIKTAQGHVHEFAERAFGPFCTRKAPVWRHESDS